MEDSEHRTPHADACREVAEHRARFEFVYRVHGELIYRYCLRRLRDPALAEDACSSVFIEAWRRRDVLDVGDRAGLPWLYGVARNVLRNQRRALRRHDAVLMRLPRPTSSFESVDDVDDRLDAARAAHHVHRLIEALPSGERAVVILCLANELSYASAADRLGVPVGTVRSRLSRARERLASSTARTPC